MHASHRVELLGSLRFVAGPVEIDRFRTKKVAELLAFLSFHRDRMCTREELANVLWPDDYDDSARMNRLSNALSALRIHMESPSVPKGSVLEANRYSARLRPETAQVDVLDFKAAIKACSRATELKEKIEHAERAFHLYRGDFAPTLDSDWVFAERARLEDAYGLLLANLRDLWAQQADFAPAIEYGSRLVETDPYNESAHADLIRLYLKAGKTTAAHDQLAALGKVLEELDATPSPDTLALLDSAPERPNNFRRVAVREATPAVVETSLPHAVAGKGTSSPSLPFQTTRFFGRDEEIALALQILHREGVRMVTLIGPGGSGKTRLSIEIARAAAERFEGRVFFAALADVTDPSFIGDAILAGLGAVRQPTIPVYEQIAATLEPNRASLIVFDNVEQLLEDIGAAAEVLLAHVPSLKIVATSRRNLNLKGETEMHVPPLPLPLPDKDLTPAEMIALPSVALFVDRAQHVCADFQLTQRNAPAVAELCRKLDGMPLAIELAATWAKTLSPQQMLLQLARRFDFLVTRRRDVPARHQKMLAIIESSYMQLDPALREFFVKLSVFEGGWTLEAAQAICAAPKAMSWLQELLERTLIISTQLDTPDGGCTMRFGMLETVKAFCENQLDAEEKDALLLAHLNYFADYAKTEGQPFYSYVMKMPLQAFVADLPNYRLALKTAIFLSVWEQPSKILLYTYEGWEDLGLLSELLEWVEQVPTGDMDDRTLVFMTRQRARCYRETGRFEQSVPLYEDCLDRFLLLGEKEGVAGTCANLALTCQGLGDVEGARLRIDQALGLARTLGNRPLLARVTVIQALILATLGDVDGACESYKESLRLSKGEGISAAVACDFLAAFEIMAGRCEEAEALCEKALAILDKSPHAVREVLVRLTLARCANASGDLDRALHYFLVATELVKRSNDPTALASFLMEVASMAQGRNDGYTALVMVYAADLDRRASIEFIQNPNLTVAGLSASLGSAQAARAASIGQAMSLSEAIRFAEEFLKNLKENLVPQQI